MTSEEKEEEKYNSRLLQDVKLDLIEGHHLHDVELHYNPVLTKHFITGNKTSSSSVKEVFLPVSAYQPLSMKLFDEWENELGSKICMIIKGADSSNTFYDLHKGINLQLTNKSEIAGECTYKWDKKIVYSKALSGRRKASKMK